jgi:hypothetical protein
LEGSWHSGLAVPLPATDKMTGLVGVLLFREASANVDSGAASTGYSPRSMRMVGSNGIHRNMDSHSSRMVDTHIRNNRNAGQS